ncbi:DUF4328 domain-containing protein [Streptomyces sp. NPDC051940]|uniref:DUF4328 domain-containing protein n=1 Tax=Streptomyces sp. NPDC051940 TaxID=3155675 RepID=UPI00342D8E3E
MGQPVGTDPAAAGRTVAARTADGRFWYAAALALLAADAGVALWLLGRQIHLHGLVTGGAWDAALRDEMWTDNLLDVLRALTLATVIVFLLWFQSVRDATEARLPGRRERGGRSWSMIWWFVPVVNLWMGLRITLDVWSANAAEGSRARSAGWLPVAGWWVLSMYALTRFEDAAREFDEASSGVRTGEAAAEMRESLAHGMAADGWYLAGAAATAALVVCLTRTARRAASPRPR